MASYQGVPLLTPTAEQVALVAANFDPLEIHQGFRAPYARTTPLNTLHVPWGARRWGEGWFLCDSDQLAQIEATGVLSSSAGGVLTQTDGLHSVNTRLRCLTPRPLFGDPAKDRLWLLILVDDRYFWWDHTFGSIGEAPADSWVLLLLQVAKILGGSWGDLSYLLDYLLPFNNPPKGFVSYSERVPELLDRICWSTQIRMSLSASGPIFWNPQAAAGQVFFRTTGEAQVSAGGTHPDVPLPAQLRIVFPTTQNGAPSRQTYFIDINAPEGTLTYPEVAAYDCAAIAVFSANGGSFPVNYTQLHDLAVTWSRGWYAWRALSHDIRYAGVYSWNGDGVTDVEYSDDSTRATSRHDNDDITVELDAGAGTGTTDTNNYYNTTLVIDTTNVTVNNSTFYFTGINNWYVTLGSVLFLNGPGYVVVTAPLVECDWLYWCYLTYNVNTAVLVDFDLFGLAGLDNHGRVVIRFTSGADFALDSIVSIADLSGEGAGQVLALVNASPVTMTIVHGGAGSEPFSLEGAANQTVQKNGCVLCWKDPTSGVWRTFRQADSAAAAGGETFASYVPTSEATSSTTYTDLATQDTLTFTLTGPADLLIEYESKIALPASAGPSAESGWNQLYLDGVSQVASDFGGLLSSVTMATNCQCKVAGVAAGAHTVLCKHKTNLGTSTTWSDRVVKVTVL